LKRHLDTWERNRSTSGLTLWQIYDGYELARPSLFGCFATCITYFQKWMLSFRLSAYRLSFKVEAVGHFTWLRPVHAAPTRSLAFQRPEREFLCMCIAHACSSVT
jgi:hypothetical protein